MTDAKALAAATKQLKARGAKARRGHLRLQVGELWWYLDPRLSGSGLVIETGCWTAELPPEPDGGAVDCPLLFDHHVTHASVDVDSLVDLVTGIGDLATLSGRLPELPAPLVDRSLRDLLQGRD